MEFFMRQVTRSLKICFFLAATFLFFSCIGLETEIEITSSGSGTISLEYRVSGMILSMGMVEDEAFALHFPIEQEDFEDSLVGNTGLSLRRYSSRKDGDDLLISAELQFATLGQLVAFLSETGQVTQLEESARSNTLIIRLSEGAEPLENEFNELVQTLFNDYILRFRFRAPRAVRSSGVPVQNIDARTVEYRAPIGEVLSAEEPLIWELSW